MTVLANARHILIDLDGVLYRGDSALPHAEEFIAWLRAQGISFRLVTNNATLTRAQYVEKLARLGMTVAEEEIFTSSLATQMYLERAGARGERAFVIGEDGLQEAVVNAGLSLAADDPQWVIAGLDRRLTYDKLATAALAIERGARFVGSNPDTSFPTERGLIPGAGAILQAIQVTTGVEPIVIGKPKPLMLQLAMEHVGGSSSDTIMLGDRLDTDIAAAQAVGIPSILVLTGVSTRDDLAGSPFHPDLVVQDLADLGERWVAAR